MALEPPGSNLGQRFPVADRPGEREQLPPPLFVRHRPGKGRGVYANRPFRTGEQIEWIPVLIVPADQLKHLDRTILRDYYFAWGPGSLQGAIALGYGSLYNHSYHPNACFRPYDEASVELVALRDISPGDEITVNYHGDPEETSPVWFKVEE